MSKPAIATKAQWFVPPEFLDLKEIDELAARLLPLAGRPKQADRIGPKDINQWAISALWRCSIDLEAAAPKSLILLLARANGLNAFGLAGVPQFKTEERRLRFWEAAEAEALTEGTSAAMFTASAEAVGRAAGVDAGTVRDWRDASPLYATLVEHYRICRRAAARARRKPKPPGYARKFENAVRAAAGAPPLEEE